VLLLPLPLPPALLLLLLLCVCIVLFLCQSYNPQSSVAMAAGGEREAYYAQH
jgi:hypothetical protein